MRPGTLFSGLFHPSREEQADLFAMGAHAETGGNPKDISDALEGHLFEGGPPTRLLTALGLMRRDSPQVALRMGLAVAIGWLPLLLLTAIESVVRRDASFASFLSDFGVHARSLFAAPLFIAAEAYSLPRLSIIAAHFATSGVIAAKDAPAFTRAVVSTLRLRDSLRFEFLVVAVAASLIVTLSFRLPADIFPAWQVAGAHAGRTAAALWHEFVSVPILVVLVLGWLWRIFIWSRFLVLVSHLDLRLVAAHPDRAGGLGFLGLALEATSLLAFALGTIVAGTVANRVMDGVSLFSFRYVLLAFVVVVALLFVSPLFAFTKKLIETFERGVLEYGALARSLGLQMERRWLNHAASPETLDANDFSATTDLYAVVANAYRVLPVPVSLRDIVVLVVATLLPFVPVALLVMSPAALFEKLTGIAL